VSTLEKTTLEIADGYWAQDLGCTRDELRPRAPRLQSHAGGLTGYPGVFILVLDGAAPVVSVPAELQQRLSARSDEFTAAAVATPDGLRHLLAPTEIARVIGPAQLNYADAATFRPTALKPARKLGRSDREQFEGLQAACDPADWDGKGFDLEARHTFGAFDEQGELRAVADFDLWAERIAHLSVVAHPQAQGRGYGPSAVAAAASFALESSLVLQYRALRDNRASLRVAAKLGFQSYGWSMAARLSG
jgi:GNAT superfamily N-acetyltransferase